MQNPPASSSRVYLMKSAFSTRIRMVAKNPVSSSTVTHELTMLNQWICGAHRGVCDCLENMSKCVS